MKAAPKIALVLKGYPRLSETFIAQEIHALEARGLDITIYSLRHPTDHSVHPIHEQIQARVVYLPEYLYQEPVRVLRGLLSQLRRPAFFKVFRTWWKDLRRDLTSNRVRRFGQALVLANELEQDDQLIYAHFLHTPGSVARYTSNLTGLPWACSAHAKDIWTIPDWEITEKLTDCQWLTTCTQGNVDHLRALAPDLAARIFLTYHGLDVNRLSPPPANHSVNDGSDPEHPVHILSVGRAVAKKGYDDLLTALSQLTSTRHWRFVHIGGGPLLEALKSRADALGIGDRVSWLGPQSQAEVFNAYQNADIFVLSSVVDKTGDRDGLPNVLMEAQLFEVPVVSTSISGIPEFVVHEENGLLVEPGQPEALGLAIEQLVVSPDLRRQLGQSGKARIHQKFSLDDNISSLTELLIGSAQSSEWSGSN